MNDVAETSRPNLKERDAKLANLSEEERASANELEARRDVLQNAHWTPEVLGVVPKAIDLLASKRLAAFHSKPSLELYRSVVCSAPQLQESLLDYSREYFLGARSTSHKLGSAFEIFLHAHQDEDLLRAMHKAGTLGSDDNYEEHMRKALSYLMTRTPETRVASYVYLEQGLLKVQETILKGLGMAFPQLTTGWEYLKAVTDNGMLSKIAPDISSPDNNQRTGDSSSTRPSNALRDPYLQIFCKRVGYILMDEEEEESLDLDDDVLWTIHDWVIILDNWPNKAERNTIKKSLRNDLVKRRWNYPSPPADGSAFYDVDGVADILARRCVHHFPCYRR